MARPEPTQRPLTVTELSGEVRGRVRGLTAVLVKGEVSGLRRNAKGSFSFDIKDAECAIRGWIWERDAARLPLLPEDGQQYVFRGRVDYWRTGNLVFVVDLIQHDDVGRLRARLEALKHKLELEGAFAAERKRRLPFLPRAVALVTSPTGAVIHDLQETVRERYPNMEILVYPAQVQGMASPGSVVVALRQCNRDARADVVVIARGGGGFEELYAFNTEPVARAILASRIPVVTALGHTSDRTIADLVADVESRTPTAAAATVVPRKTDLVRQLTERRRRLDREIGHRLSAEAERVDGRQQRLAQVLPALLRGRRERLERCRTQLARLSPDAQLERREQALAERRRRLVRSSAEALRRRAADLAGRSGPERIARAGRRRLSAAADALEHRRARLLALSPDSVLARGYSITFDAATGTVVRRARDTEPGRHIRVRLAEGGVGAQVEDVQASDQASDQAS
ncbi:MAG: exodeoxyribonuclease VII large subunit [bacterium]|nr:exodeoxyribonuclease VII large subunit [bacterium]